MQHYKKDEWQSYVLGELEEDLVASMEDHLYICDDCMSVYLDLLEATTPLEEVEISEDFTNRVLAEIDFKPRLPKIKPQGNRKIIFRYYVVAASITMLLTYSGFFEMITNEVPKAATEMVATTKRVEALVPDGWSQRLMDSTLKTLQLIKIKQGSEQDEN